MLIVKAPGRGFSLSAEMAGAELSHCDACFLRHLRKTPATTARTVTPKMTATAMPAFVPVEVDVEAGVVVAVFDAGKIELVRVAELAIEVLIISVEESDKFSGDIELDEVVGLIRELALVAAAELIDAAVLDENVLATKEDVSVYMRELVSVKDQSFRAHLRRSERDHAHNLTARCDQQSAVDRNGCLSDRVRAFHRSL